MTSINIPTANTMKDPAEFRDFALSSTAVMRQDEFCPLSRQQQQKKEVGSQNKMSISFLCCTEQAQSR